jgi:large subunit ribosomal protein L9
MVQVILLERIERLGQMGDVVNVKPGFARNFLLPQKKALRATKQNLEVFEQRKAQLVADNLQRREEAEAVSKKMVGLTVSMVRQAGESGQLYGSVNARDIAEAVVAAGFTVQRGQVVIDKPIKAAGVHSVRVTLHPEVTVTVGVSVAPSQDEADAQLRGEEPPAAPEAPAADEPAA